MVKKNAVARYNLAKGQVLVSLLIFMEEATLVGCLCLFDQKCKRGCQRPGQKILQVPRNDDATLVEFRFDPRHYPDDDTAYSFACLAVEDMEAKLNKPVVSLEAWSNGLIRMWFS